MEQMERSGSVEKKVELIDRKKEKEMVRPYRKYQLLILGLVIMMIVFCSSLFSLNKELNYHIRENTALLQELDEQNQRTSELDELFNRVEVNYISLYELDKELNIDIIRDLSELGMVTGFISKDNESQFSVCYKATIHGDKASKFREFCSGVSPLLILIETEDGYRFGAYTTVAFLNDETTQGQKADNNAFLFSFDTKKKYKIEIPDVAVRDVLNSFPMFGKNDLNIIEGFFSESKSWTEYPQAFEPDPNAPGDYILNGGMKKFKIKEMEVLTVFINSN